MRRLLLSILLPIALAGCANDAPPDATPLERVEDDIPKSRQEAEEQESAFEDEETACPECEDE
jgi:hypothetical protein